jgi:hypothetical protein
VGDGLDRRTGLPCSVAHYDIPSTETSEGLDSRKPYGMFAHIWGVEGEATIVSGLLNLRTVLQTAMHKGKERLDTPPWSLRWSWVYRARCGSA